MNKRSREKESEFKRLRSIATIRTGHTFRSKIVDTPTGDLPVIQIKDVRRGARVEAQELPRIHSHTIKDGPNVDQNDILLPARGDYSQAAIWPDARPALASSQLFVLTIKDTSIRPAYLSWYLNQPAAQHYFQTQRTGTNIPMLSKKNLGTLSVPIPLLTTQDTIITIEHCWQREQQVIQQLRANREKMLKGIYQQLLEQ